MSRLYIVVALIFFVSCTYYKNQPLSEPLTPRWEHFDSLWIDKTKLQTSRLTKEFYRANNFQLVWIDTGGLTKSADSLILFIKSAKYYGLNPEDYHLSRFNNFLKQPHSKNEAVAVDLSLTDSFFALYYHLRDGRVEKESLNPFDLSNLLDEEALSVLKKVLSDGSIRKTLEKQQPVLTSYQSFKTELASRLSENFTDGDSLFKVDQLMVNMERCRWQKKSYPDRYVRVNVPSYMLKVVEHDSVMLQSRVIIGKRETPTPELESVIRSFIIYPYWHVPRSIIKEMLPTIQRDSLYLVKHNFEVLDQAGNVLNDSTLDWNSFTAENFPYILRQREGSENTMGVMKFVFSNKYGVYLHDTNARGLFSKDKRDLSHGCVRVQKAVGLAKYLAKDDDTYVTPEDIDQYLLVRHKLAVNVVKPIPVILEYFTTSVDGGEVKFYNDIYGKDHDVLNAWHHYSLHVQETATPTYL